MGIIKQTLKKQIDNDNLTRLYETIGTILSYDQVHNTCCVNYYNPATNELMYRDNVHVASTMGAIHTSCLLEGQKCVLAFLNGNIYNPILTGIINNFYAFKRNPDQGAYLVDSYISNIEEPNNISPMLNDYILDDNISYQSDLYDYSDIDIDKECNHLISNLDKYNKHEHGITNLDTGATIKLKSNGDIDIFIDNNTGISISSSDNSINLYGNVKINGKNIF